MVAEEKDEAWVTLAVSDVEALQAIVLAKSLEQALTTRKTFILVSEQVSVEMRYLLLQVFYGVRCVSKEELELMGLSDVKVDSVAKLWCWTLQQFKKCVFLNPNFLARENPDTLFVYDDLSTITENEIDEKLNTSFFVFKPNFQNFEDLLKLALEKKNGDEVLNEFYKVWNKIPSTCIIQNSQDSEGHPGHFSGSFIRFEELPWLPKNQQNSKEWLQVYYQCISPLFKNQTIDSVREFVKKLVELNQLPEISSADLNLEENLEDYRGTIAVVGMSCRFPGANSPAEYWKLLSEGREAIRTLPSDRPHLGGRETWGTEAGFLSCAIDEFDAKFFGISPREALLMDPQQRLLLEVTWESLENAGINPQTLKNSDTGVYVGMWQQDYERIILADARKTTEANDASHFLHTFLGNKYSATASRVSFCLGLNGPALAVESGCSSSLNGVHLACESLHTGETSLALVSGVNLILVPVNPFSGRNDDQESVVLSKDFRCKTFDENANGFVRAEGCGVVVLKRFEDARRDGDNILSVIRGSAVNNDGQGTSFGTPNEKAQEKVYRAAMKRGNVSPADVSFIETHGTGTIVACSSDLELKLTAADSEVVESFASNDLVIPGDPIEMYAVGQAYSANRTEPLMVGSVKTNIGHCEAAAGIASLIKVILCIQNEAIPQHLNMKTLNPRINLERIPAIIPMKLTSWTTTPKIAAVSSFSMSATNAHVIVQEPPRPRAITNTPSESMQMVTISAKSEEALKALSENFVEFLKTNTTTPLSDIAYSANIGRASLQHRIAIVANDTQQLLARLDKRSFVMGKAATLKSKIGFLFTGQGSQYIGMAKGLQEVFPAFRKALRTCESLFQSSLNESLENVIWNDNGLLNQTLYCQPAIFCIQYCLLQLWASFGIQPDFVLGHSIGEFAAAVCSGILKLEDAMKLVVARSKLINELPMGSMLAIRAPEKTVKELISGFIGSRKDIWIDIAAVNSPEEVVVSGQTDFVKQFEELCMNNGVKSVSIPATHAFHSREMDVVLSEFGKTAETVEIGEPKCVYVSGTLSRVMESMEFGSNYWQRHLRDTVRFSEAISLVWAECKTLVEIGAQPILLGLAMGNVESNAGVFCPSLRRKDDSATAFYGGMSKLYVNGTDFDWTSIYGVRQKSVNLPHYPFQRQKYWFVDEEANDDELSPILHPLLGRQFLSPLAELVFCQTFRLRELSYMEDHKVADYVVVPMAGLLETFMAASREVLQGGSQNKFPITIENMMIEAALPLESRCKIQTLVSSEGSHNSESGVQYRLSLNRKMGHHYDKWKRHAQAVFSPSSKLPEQLTLNLEELKSRLTHKESLESNYQQIADIGIQFGPKFQSLKSAWFGPEELLTEIHIPDNSNDYICHPIVLDAIIQTYAFREFLLQTKESKEMKKNLYLPISIKKFTWLSKTPSQIVFAHSSGKTGNLTLYSSSGEPLGMMEGLELVQTTTTSIIRSIRAEALEVPEFMCDKWRACLGKTCTRVDMSKLGLPSVNSEEYRATLVGVEDWREGFVSGTDFMLVRVLIIAIHESGWPWPATGDILEAEVWRKLLPTAVNSNVIKQYCIQLENFKFLQAVSEDSYQVLRPLPSAIECEAEISEKKRQPHKLPFDPEPENHFGDWYGKCLPAILQGKMTPLEFLFPEDTSAHGAQYYYTQSYMYNHQNVIVKVVLLDVVKQLAGAPSKEGILRILEVGAGTGSSAVPCITALNELKVPFHYTFTDISPLFLNEAKNKLNLGPNVTYQTLNIEQDPLTQGFAPEEFDIIIGVQVLHATSSLTESVGNLKKLLKPNGVVLFGEGFRLTVMQSFLFGMLDGWWRFSDFRRNGALTALASEEQWTTVLESLGFDNVVTDPGIMVGVVAGRNASLYVAEGEAAEPLIKKNWILLNDSSQLGNSVAEMLKSYDRNVVVVNQGSEPVGEAEHGAVYLNPDNPPEYVDLLSKMDSLEGLIYLATNFDNEDVVETQHRIAASLLNLFKAYEANAGKFKARPKFVVATRGVYNIGDSEPGNPNGATAWGMMKVFRNEYPNHSVLIIDLNHRPSPMEAKQVFTQLWSTDEEHFVAFREDKQYVLRLKYVDKPAVPVHLPHTDRFKFINPPSGAFADMEIGPSPQKDVVEDYVELELRATALNFRDLFMVLKPDGFVLPDNSYVTLNSVGLDISGVVVSVGPQVTKFQVGDEVFGLTVHGGLGSHTLTNEKALMKIPKYMTFAEACTIPCAFVTAYVGLTSVAKITAEDRVLIHVATGGVGLASVQVVRAAGSEIFATAGSRRKRAYLRALGIKHVYHSRDTSYREGIMRDTQGAGVTVVLNSLTGPEMKEATLDTCCQGARFVEIAKINIWKPEEVEALRPDVKYTIVDLSNKDAVQEGGHADFDLDKASQQYFSKIEEFVQDGTYKGLPSVIFPLTQLRDAFTYFQKARHIGKIVVSIPKTSMTGPGKFIHTHCIFNEKSTYLITGGLGGIGVEVTKWMLTLGARTIVLVGRAQPKSSVQKLLDEWNRAGSNVVVIQADVGEFEGCQRVLEQVKHLNLPPLRGIMHAAGVLADNFLPNQTLKDFEYVLKPKVYGGWFLHNLTIDYQLEFFVMFSSLSGILGMVGQCNHASANRFLDSLAHFRESMGLPSTTINWGGWSDVGAAAHLTSTVEVFSGMRAFTPAQGLAALNLIMSSRETQVAVSEVTDWNLVKDIFRQGKYFEEMKSHKMEDNKFDRFDHLIEDIKKATSTEEREERIQVYIAAILKQTLNLPQTEVLDINQDFSEFGVDSLMAMEMKNRFHDLLGDKTLSISSLQENRTIRSLSAHLAHVMESETVVLRPLAEVIQEDVVLPAEITAAETPALRPSQFKSVLLTGATGHLGIHCLVECLKVSHGLTVHCILRGTSDDEARERLEKTLTNYKINITNMENVTVVAGDVTKDKLGLTDEIYEGLSQQIDAIIHCAAKTSHVDNYQDGSKHDLRSNNVVGLVNILKFACSNKTKPIFHASTLMAATKVQDGLLSEEYPDSAEMGEAITWGYPLSKFVGEKLLSEARQRGIPVTTFRFPGLFGSSETGYMPPGYNHLWSTVLASVRVRMVPEFKESKGVPIMAVDSAAHVAMTIFLNDNSEDGVYNFTVDSFASEEVIQEGLYEHGISCEFVPFKEWRQAVFEEQGGNILGPVASLYADEDGESRLFRLHSLSKEAENIDVSSFSPKVRRNYPDVSSYVQCASTVIRNHLRSHFEALGSGTS